MSAAPPIKAPAISRTVAFLIKELKEVLPPTLFFAIGFNLIEFTTQLILDDYLVRFANFMVATAAALVVGKAVLVANLLPVPSHFDKGPLIQPVLFKTVVYTIVVFLVRFLERLVEYSLDGGAFGDIMHYVALHFSWHRFAANQIWIFVLFLLYTSVTELNARLGDGALLSIFFSRRRAPST